LRQTRRRTIVPTKGKRAGDAAMIDRSSTLKAIQEIYEARESGDLEAVAARMHPDIRYKIAGDPAHCGACVSLEGRAAAMEPIAAMVEVFAFEALEMLESVVEDGKAAILWRATLTHRPSGEVFPCEVFDLWTLDETGLFTGLTQFCDTALINHPLTTACRGAF
jgi:ketosteroid isomerase-like protein